MSRKLLVVDDNEINRQMLINVLCNDYDIIEAENGREALALINRNYKLLSAVLMDIVMPEMNGYEVLKAVRENPLLAQIPIIMVTGSEDEASRVKALSYGANDFILKPFNPEIVRHCLRNNIALRETASILNAIQKDKLTGVFNREAFFERTNAAIREKEPGYYTLSCFDIDNFKLLNDRYGTAEGDRLLKQIGAIILSAMDKIGGIAGRISADNFVLLFPTDKADDDIITHLQLSDVVTVDRRSLVFSVGRYTVTDLSLPASSIYDRAFLAKQSVKGRYDKHLTYFDETMLQRLVMDQQIVGDMESALSNRDFEVWFQPQYNHATGALIGAEALVRWRHPEKGIIPPSEFIPLFEQNGFIYELDKYVWAETCACIRRWLDSGISPMPVSVNISRYDIFRSDLIPVLSGLLQQYAIPISLLRLEVTESAFSRSADQIVDIIKQLVALGFTVEIDDFGSGYSSLNTLKSVPAQVVKLDMKFLADDNDARRGGSILESVVRMTRWLGMSVIAEGVETIEQADYLKSIGCGSVQGYLYARPMPVADYEAIFKIARREADSQTVIATENFNNGMFWDPSSMDSLLFNSYAGAVCIYEYFDGGFEVLRATEKYVKMLNPNLTVEQLLNFDLMSYLEKDDAARLVTKISNSIETDPEVTEVFTLLDFPGCPHETFVRAALRVIARSGDRSLIYGIHENITAQRETERNERRLSKQLEAVMHSLSCGVTAATMQNGVPKILLANDRFYEIIGFSGQQHEEISFEKFFTSVIPEDVKRIKEIADRCRITGNSESTEFRMTRLDGRVIWLRCSLSSAVFEDVDEPVQLCTYTDISSERNTAQNLLDNLPCGAGLCVVTRDDVKMTYLNKRYLSYFKNNSTLRDASVFSLVHPDDRAVLKEQILPALGEGGVGSCVVRIRDGDGYIPFRLSGVAMHSDGKQGAIYVTFVPIAAEDMAYSEMLPVLLEKMMSSTGDLSFVKDKNLRYICCSRAFAEMVGLENERDIIGKTDYDLFPSDLADSYVDDDRRLMTSEESIVDMVEALPSDDWRQHYSSTSKYLLYSSSGEVIGLYGTGHDITQELEAENRQKFLINNIHGGVAVYEGQWTTLESIRLAYFSDGFCRLFGYTREEYEKLGNKNPTGLVLPEFLPGLVSQITALISNGTPIDYVCRAKSKSGNKLWINIKGTCGERHGENMTVNTMLSDVTELQEVLERLRMSEEENRLALCHSSNVVCRYDTVSKSLQVSSSVDPIFEMSESLDNVPYSQVSCGAISPETAGAYAEFYENILRGEKTGSTVFQRKSTEGWRWIEAQFSSIFSDDNTPVSAVVSFCDVTESYEKDAAHMRWLQSLHNKEPDSYTLFRCNISRNTPFDTVEGRLMCEGFDTDSALMPVHTAQYAGQCVYIDDRDRYLNFLNIDSLLEKYRSGERILTLEYREKTPDGDYRWLRVTVNLVQYPHSNDVEAYLLFEDIDAVKRSELQILRRAETDPLTGILNRQAFEEKVNSVIRASAPDDKHALLMLDIDGFKLVNDGFGHDAGDQTLVDIADLLRTILRRNDLLGRLGGDEFVVFLNNIPGEHIAAKKAKQICELSRKAFSEKVEISGSVGIAVCPSDGVNFDSLYKKADEALYHVKGSGRDNFAFYHADMENSHVVPAPIESSSMDRLTEAKRRMLIVDDNKIDCEMLVGLFCDEFIIEKARGGESALAQLRHYGTSISVVLLDLIMPEIDGFEVLEKMQKSADMRQVPVVVVSGADDRETSLRAIRAGASDFVMKPVDADILRIRVRSAISKAENERLRLKNSFLELQSSETVRYKAVLDRIGLAVIEIDWGKSAFTYSPSVSEHIGGTFDNRTLWHILLSDLVTDAETVRKIQQFVHELADNRQRTEDSITARLKTPSGGHRLFAVNAYKLANEYGLTDKIIMTFKELDDANENS